MLVLAGPLAETALAVINAEFIWSGRWMSGEALSVPGCAQAGQDSGTWQVCPPAPWQGTLTSSGSQAASEGSVSGPTSRGATARLHQASGVVLSSAHAASGVSSSRSKLRVVLTSQPLRPGSHQQVLFFSLKAIAD